jgi:hypothetical protein
VLTPLTKNIQSAGPKWSDAAAGSKVVAVELDLKSLIANLFSKGLS